MIGGNQIIYNLLQNISALREALALQGLSEIAGASLEEYILQTVTPEMLGVTTILFHNAFGNLKLSLNSYNGFNINTLPQQMR